MERSSEYHDLAVALAEVRPTPRPEFTAELDKRVATGFPRRPRPTSTPLSSLASRLRAIPPRRFVLRGGAATLATVAVAAAIIASSDSRQPPIASQPGSARQNPGGSTLGQLKPFSKSVEPTAEAESVASAGVHFGAANGALSTESLSSASGLTRLSYRPNRDIERSAQIALLAEPTDVAEDSTAVFAAVHDARGIVLRSTTASGSRAGAHFDLLIPSPKLGGALAAISAIDEVRSRRDATDDITAPTVSAREELQDSRARIDTLLAQFSTAETEAEADAIETELRDERRQAARLRTRLANLNQRTAYSRVTVQIESDATATSGGAWGFDDALGDSGRVLGIAAAVTLIGLAVLIPLALIAFLAWLAHRLWLRASRERALDA